MRVDWVSEIEDETGYLSYRMLSDYSFCFLVYK